jgi:hypothetical protein
VAAEEEGGGPRKPPSPGPAELGAAGAAAHGGHYELRLLGERAAEALASSSAAEAESAEVGRCAALCPGGGRPGALLRRLPCQPQQCPVPSAQAPA